MPCIGVLEKQQRLRDKGCFRGTVAAKPCYINTASIQPRNDGRLGMQLLRKGRRTLTRVVDTLKVYPASRGTPKEESMTTTSTLSTEPTSSGMGVYSRPLPICG